MLRHLGCRVTTCTDGEEAVAHYRAAQQSGAPFDLVLTDIVVPVGMGGLDAAKAILQLDPGAKLIASSGYSREAVMSDPKLFGFVEFLPKPYTISQLESLLVSVWSKEAEAGS